MARVDYSGVPDVSPDLQAPDDYQHVEASPNAFGAQLAQGAEALGGAALDTSKFYGQVAADNGVNNFLDQRSKLIYGDPSQGVKTDASGAPMTAPDGSPVFNGGFMGLRGADAMRAAPEVSAQLKEMMQDNRQSLATPMAQYQYDTASRRYYEETLNDIGRHTDQQQRVWATDTNTTAMTLAFNDGVNFASDPDKSASALDRALNAATKNTQFNGGNPELARLKTTQDFYALQVKGTLETDPDLAAKILNDHKDVLASTPEYDALTQRVNSAEFQRIQRPTIGAALDDAKAQAAALVHTPVAAAAPVAGGNPNHAYQALPDTAKQQINNVVANLPDAKPMDARYLVNTETLESGGHANAQNGSSTSLFQFHPDTAASVGITDIHDPAQQIQGALTLARKANTALTKVLGRAPSPAETYIGHQQGPAGGPALLGASPDTNAVAALTPAYKGNADRATQAIAGNIGLPYKTADQKAAANAAAQSMTAGQFTDFWRQRYAAADAANFPGADGAGGAGGAGAQPNTSTGGYPSVADALNATHQDRVDAFQKQLEANPLFANHPDRLYQTVDMFSRQLDQAVDQQKRQTEVDAHIVQSVMAGPNPPISEGQLVATSPQVANAWNSLLFNNPYVRQGIENRFNANAKGKALSYGTNFKDYFDRAMAPTGDPNRLTDPTQLNNYVGPGEDAPLTNTGSDQLTQLMALRSTPQGEAVAAQMRTFVDQMHAELTYSNNTVGTFDPKGEARFSRAMAQVLPMLVQAQQAGTLSKVLDPKNADYVGNVAATFARPPAQIMKDRLFGENIATKPYLEMGEVTQGQYLLKEAVAQGRLTREQAIAIGEEHGYFAKPKVAAPPGQKFEVPKPEVHTIDPATGRLN